MTQQTKRLAYLFAIALALGSLSACGDDDNGEENDPNNNNDAPGMTALEEACLHAREDIPLDRDASAERDDVDENIAGTHTHYRVNLPESGEEPDHYEGYIGYNIDDGDTYGLFTSSDMPVAIFDADGDELSIDTQTVDECPEIITQHTLELDAGDHFLRFGPSSQSELSTVSEILSEHH